MREHRTTIQLGSTAPHSPAQNARNLHMHEGCTHESLVISTMLADICESVAAQPDCGSNWGRNAFASVVGCDAMPIAVVLN
jgi:hypothetical protein